MTLDHTARCICTACTLARILEGSTPESDRRAQAEMVEMWGRLGKDGRDEPVRPAAP